MIKKIKNDAFKSSWFDIVFGVIFITVFSFATIFGLANVIACFIFICKNLCEVAK
jgi:hypothetical protein